MNTRRPYQNPSLEAVAVEAEIHDAFPARRELPRRAAIACGVLLGSLALSLVLSSCGGSKSQGVPGDAFAETATPLVVEAAGSPGGFLAPSAADTDGVVRESLPPDLSVTAMDTEVARGQSVELYVEATPDVVELTLWDGLHDKQSLTYDSGAKVWHGSYRVPLSTRLDRIGLSITARNQASQWRRVWVFLTVGSDQPEVEEHASESQEG